MSWAWAVVSAGSSTGATTSQCSGRCPIGYASSAGDTGCTICRAGYYASVAGSTSCTPWCVVVDVVDVQSLPLSDTCDAVSDARAAVPPVATATKSAKTSLSAPVHAAPSALDTHAMQAARLLQGRRVPTVLHCSVLRSVPLSTSSAPALCLPRAATTLPTSFRDLWRVTVAEVASRGVSVTGQARTHSLARRCATTARAIRGSGVLRSTARRRAWCATPARTRRAARCRARCAPLASTAAAAARARAAIASRDSGVLRAVRSATPRRTSAWRGGGPTPVTRRAALVKR